MTAAAITPADVEAAALSRTRADTDKLVAETLKLAAEQAKLNAENQKLAAEATKLATESLKIARERAWYPGIVIATALGAGAAFAKLFLS